MRRWLALFLLVLLPLLSGWSAASAYGGDLSDAHAEHAVHHADPQHGDGADSGRSAPSHPDCDHCHTPGVTRPGLRADMPAPAPNLRAPWTDVALRAPPPSLPERPKWARLA
ncbi:MAG: DUF2946 domain-containing protein [Variovorax sp.]|nr:MAG: DUF2946 domain-containing protein [Variovorax sp.]